MHLAGRLRRQVLALLVQLTALAAAVWWLRAPVPTSVRVLPPPTVTPAPSATPARLLVYVSGAVARPTVVSLAEGARAGDAVAAAGGFTPDADRVAVNLAAPLTDGAHLHVPEEGEAPRALALGEVIGSVPGGVAGTAVGSIPGAGGSGSGAGSGTGRGLVNVNTASGPELEALPGIGPALAQRILDYRSAHGPFGDVRDLLKVSGVGEKTLARFADRVTVR